MDIGAILEEFHKPPPFFPASALRAAAERQEEITPTLLELLAEAAAGASESGESEDMAGIYALFLLAQFHEARAYPLLVRLASLPSSAVHSLLGDMLTEDLAALLASVSQGEPSGMQFLVENEAADVFARTAALRAMVILVKVGEQRREDVLEYFGSLFRGKLRREPSFLWGCLISDCLDLYPDTIREELEQGFAEGLDCEHVCSSQHIQKTLAQGKERVLAELGRNSENELITDAVTRMEWWACFHPDEAPLKSNPELLTVPELPIAPAVEPYRREGSKVGRNDPCPCGSGRKYKKCCGAG
jgi:hypothetical protein